VAARYNPARLYSLLFCRVSTFALTIAIGSLFLDHAFDQGADVIYEHINQGKRRCGVTELNSHRPL
uniref:Complex III subunit 9 n=1 Tax=Prolemur simus TaxID=1328070 RepID=A0A8C8YCZ1_PROSS